MEKHQLRASADPTNASRECLVHTAEATFALKTTQKCQWRTAPRFGKSAASW